MPEPDEHLTASELLGLRARPDPRLAFADNQEPGPRTRLMPPTQGVEEFHLEREAQEEEFLLRLRNAEGGEDTYMLTVEETLNWITFVIQFGRDRRFEAEQIADYVWNHRKCRVLTATGFIPREDRNEPDRQGYPGRR